MERLRQQNKENELQPTSITVFVKGFYWSTSFEISRDQLAQQGLSLREIHNPRSPMPFSYVQEGLSKIINCHLWKIRSLVFNPRWDEIEAKNANFEAKKPLALI